MGARVEPASSAPPGWPLVVLVAVLLLHAGEVVWVASTDLALPYLATLDHHGRAARMYADLFAGGPGIAPRGDRLPAWESFAVHCGYRPPLPIVAAVPAIGLDPTRPSLGGLAGAGWTALLLVSAYAIGRRLADQPTGLVAAVVLGAFPSVLGHRILVLPFLPEAACVAAFAAALLAVRAGGRGAHLRAGAWAGAAMLCRWDAAAFLAALVVWFFVATPRGERLRAAVRAWPAALAFMVVGGWWYVLHVRMVFGFYVGEGLITLEHSHEGIHLLSFANLVFHPVALFTCHAGPVLGVGAAIALVWLARARHASALLLLAWIALPWLFYLVVPMKSARYLLPAMCPFAVALALAARRAGRGWLVGIAAIALSQHLALVHVEGVERTWNGNCNDPASWSQDAFTLEHSLDVGRIRPWTDPSWKRLVDVFARAARRVTHEPTDVLMADLGTSEYLASLELSPWLRLRSCRTLVYGPHARPEAELPNAVREHRLIVLTYPDPANEDPALARVRAAALVEVAARGAPLAQGTLPDGKRRVRLYGPRR